MLLLLLRRALEGGLSKHQHLIEFKDYRRYVAGGHLGSGISVATILRAQWARRVNCQI